MKKYAHFLPSLLIMIIGVVWFWPLIGAFTPLIMTASINRAVAGTEPTPQPITQDDSITYSSLGITAPLHVVTQASPFDVSDWSAIRPFLKQGVALLSSQATAFETLPFAYVVGHSTDVTPHRYASVFAALIRAKLGDTFVINQEGKEYAYTVTEKQILLPTDVQDFREIETPTVGKQRIALVTCWPLFTTQKRLVIVGERSI